MSASTFLEEINWRFSETEQSEDGVTVVEFRLVYQGNLLASGNKNTRSPHKQNIRRYLHKQIRRLWSLNPALQSLSSISVGALSNGEAVLNPTVRTNPGLPGSFLSQTAHWYKVGENRYVPLVTKHLCLNCSVDVLLLRRVNQHRLYSDGDLDGKIKTLMDALKMPGPNDDKTGDEDPLFCLVEDDSLITELKLVGDLLLPSEDQIVNRFEDSEEMQEPAQHHAIAVIHVQIRKTRAVLANSDF